MITYKPVKLPAGPIKVEWQTGQKNAGAWVVQLPKAPGFSYFGSPNGPDSKAGLATLRRAILSNGNGSRDYYRFVHRSER